MLTHLQDFHEVQAYLDRVHFVEAQLLHSDALATWVSLPSERSLMLIKGNIANYCDENTFRMVVAAAVQCAAAGKECAFFAAMIKPSDIRIPAPEVYPGCIELEVLYIFLEISPAKLVDASGELQLGSYRSYRICGVFCLLGPHESALIDIYLMTHSKRLSALSLPCLRDVTVCPLW